MKIVYLVSTWWAVSWYRCHTPGMALRQLGHEVELTDRIDRRWADDCDVLVCLPSGHPQVLELVRHINHRGALTVLDIDDDYWNLGPENPARSGWTPQLLQNLQQLAREVRLVTTTTRELDSTMRPMNANVTVLPNMLPDEHWRIEPRRREPGERLVLGWAGSTSHVPDVRMLEPALVQIADTYPEVEIRLAGLKPGNMRHDSRFTFLDPVRIEDYPSVLTGFDIAVAPLLDTRFNQCKSDLKLIEYGMAGLPVVASHVTPYARAIRQGENGYLAKNTKDWLKYLGVLIKDDDLRSRVADAARQGAEARLMSRNIGTWLAAYGPGDDVSPRP